MSKYIFSIEDNPNDIELIKRIFCRDIEGVEIKHIKSGEEALRMIASDDYFFEFPSLILLDIKMSGINGLDVLAEIKKSKKLEKVPVVILSSSVQQLDLERAYELKVNSYIEKPKDYQQLKETVKLLVKYWLDTNKN